MKEKDLITIRRVIYFWFSSQNRDFYECQSGREIADGGGVAAGREREKNSQQPHWDLTFQRRI